MKVRPTRHAAPPSRRHYNSSSAHPLHTGGSEEPRLPLIYMQTDQKCPLQADPAVTTEVFLPGLAVRQPAV